ncbi:hypothetical protein DPMN_096932 [Dreissena polymorpha]|uniref:Uncharacterized protein n=1 Tax=Dreissena polymorpha TaxID=45954 RepID=A0A9D4LA50_DREPO|nr:hypothetical protein DPMN_096932 [Dreissena polymorpha]
MTQDEEETLIERITTLSHLGYDEAHNNQGSANVAISSATDKEIAMDMLEPPSPPPTSLIKPSMSYSAKKEKLLKAWEAIRHIFLHYLGSIGQCRLGYYLHVSRGTLYVPFVIQRTLRQADYECSSIYESTIFVVSNMSAGHPYAVVKSQL